MIEKGDYFKLRNFRMKWLTFEELKLIKEIEMWEKSLVVNYERTIDET